MNSSFRQCAFCLLGEVLKDLLVVDWLLIWNMCYQDWRTRLSALFPSLTL